MRFENGSALLLWQGNRDFVFVFVVAVGYDARLGPLVAAVQVKMYGWFHLRGQPLFQIRAISVNDGPMQSTLRFSDLRDIVKGSPARRGRTR